MYSNFKTYSDLTTDEIAAIRASRIEEREVKWQKLFTVGLLMEFIIYVIALINFIYIKSVCVLVIIIYLIVYIVHILINLFRIIIQTVILKMLSIGVMMMVEMYLKTTIWTQIWKL